MSAGSGSGFGVEVVLNVDELILEFVWWFLDVVLALYFCWRRR